jgi:RimJ/RimL family protein N-acetyltransferase
MVRTAARCWQDSPAVELPTLSDGVVTLRPKRPEDVDAIVAACQDPEIPRWTQVPSPYTRERAVEWIAQTKGDPRTASLLAVDADGRLLGSFSVMEIDSARGYGEIGYWVAAEARRRGVATRAVVLLRDWAQAALGLSELEIMADPENLGSRRVAERAGFVETGERRANPRDPSGEAKYLVYCWHGPAAA